MFENITAEDLRALAGSEIIKVYGQSGKTTSIDVALRFPGICYIKASNGKRYDISRNIADNGDTTYNLSER